MRTRENTLSQFLSISVLLSSYPAITYHCLLHFTRIVNLTTAQHIYGYTYQVQPIIFLFF